MTHTTLDEKIVEAVRNGKTSTTKIYEAVNGVTHRVKRGLLYDYKLIDSRLDALRIRKRLIWTGSAFRSGWALPEEPTA